jgi:hypothetical protein
LARSAGWETRTIPLLALVLLPKCPVCLGMYLGFLTAFGISTVTAAKWAVAILIASGAYILAKLIRAGFVSGRIVPAAVALAGFVAILAGRFALDSALLGWSGLACFGWGCLKSLPFPASERKCCAEKRFAQKTCS